MLPFRWEFVAMPPPGAAVITDEVRIARAVAYFRFLRAALALSDEDFADAMATLPPSLAAVTRHEARAYCECCAPARHRAVLVIRKSRGL